MAQIRSTTQNEKRERRHLKIRTRIFGTALRPRISVYRSNTTLRLQLVDDQSGKTVSAASTTEVKAGSMLEKSKAAGEMLAKRAVAAGVTSAVFDRSGYVYTGKVRAAAEGARAGGLNF